MHEHFDRSALLVYSIWYLLCDAFWIDIINLLNSFKIQFDLFPWSQSHGILCIQMRNRCTYIRHEYWIIVNNSIHIICVTESLLLKRMICCWKRLHALNNAIIAKTDCIHEHFRWTYRLMNNWICYYDDYQQLLTSVYFSYYQWGSIYVTCLFDSLSFNSVTISWSGFNYFLNTVKPVNNWTCVQ